MREEEGTKINSPTVIYEDESILVVDKPSGWIVNDANTVTTQPVVQSWLKANFKYTMAKSHSLRGGIVHRLDKETSGILVIGKTEKVFYALQAQFKNREVKKSYLALLHGQLKEKKGIVEAEVGRLPWNRRKFGVLQGGRASKSEFEVIGEYLKDKEHYSLVAFRPETGRTHQIRIHAKHIGHPIVSDPLYAGRKTSRKDRAWCPRVFLHAAKITFMHPITEREVTCESPLPVELKEPLNLLEIDRSSK